MLGMQRQRGASLVELMIGMVLGMASIGAIASLVGMGIGVNGKLLAKSRLNEEIKVIMMLMERDIRRAGYSGDTQAMVGDPAASPSPFAGSLAVSQYPGEATNSCITYAYDRNQNGSLDVMASNENFGFRLRNGAVEARIDGLGCTEGGWQDLSDPNTITVTLLEYDLTTLVDNNVTSYQVDINLEARLKAKPNMRLRQQASVVVRSYD